MSYDYLNCNAWEIVDRFYLKKPIQNIKEVWTYCIFDNNYEVSNLGNIRDITTQKRLPIYGKEYYTVFINGKKEYLHRIVFFSFFPYCDKEDCNYVIDHINSKKRDCRLINLQYITRSDNSSKGNRDDSNGMW